MLSMALVCCSCKAFTSIHAECLVKGLRSFLLLPHERVTDALVTASASCRSEFLGMLTSG